MTAPSKPPRFPLGLDRLGRGPAAATGGVIRPQRPVHEAARDQTRRAEPVRARARLGGGAPAHGRAAARRGLSHEPVLAAFASVPRHRFVDTALATQAYEDTSLPIGLGQTISKPSVVARMLTLLVEGEGARERGSLGRVLEIGTGCGYQTALLALLATRVLSIERLQPLHEKAVANLADRRGDQRIRLV